MNKDTEKMMGVKNMKKVIKLIGKVLLGFVILLIVFLVITSVWHHIMSKKDRERFLNAYGEYYTTENGDKINYTLYDSNSDKIAVLLPGFAYGSVHYTFDSLAKELNDEYKVVIVEPLGYGLSDQTDTERTVENYCSELHGLMNYLGYDKYTLIGHSMSGIYMTYYSNEYTSEVEALIGIDEYVPQMRDIKDSSPETQQTVWKISRCYIFLGLDRLMPTYDRESAEEKIPTLTDEEADLFVAMDKTIPTNKTQMSEIGLMPENVDKCYDMKIPENIPVLQVLSKDNCEMYPEYTKIHEDITANSQSRTVAIDGGHSLYFYNLDGLVNEIKNWEHE